MANKIDTLQLKRALAASPAATASADCGFSFHKRVILSGKISQSKS